MRVLIVAAMAVCVLTTAACQQMETRGPHGERVTATSPRAVTLRRGDSVPLTVAIDRENFTGPVTVSVAQLPNGVSADRSSMTVDSTTATFVLKATPSADLVRNQAVALTLEGQGGRKAMQYIDLTVTD